MVKQSPITEFSAVEEGHLFTCIGLVQEDCEAKEGHVRLSYNPYFLVFLAETMFFSRNKLANSTFSHDFSAKRTGSKSFSKS
jgi:hypothetical protein